MEGIFLVLACLFAGVFRFVLLRDDPSCLQDSVFCFLALLSVVASALLVYQLVVREWGHQRNAALLAAIGTCLQPLPFAFPLFLLVLVLWRRSSMASVISAVCALCLLFLKDEFLGFAALLIVSVDALLDRSRWFPLLFVLASCLLASSASSLWWMLLCWFGIFFIPESGLRIVLALIAAGVCLLPSPVLHLHPITAVNLFVGLASLPHFLFLSFPFGATFFIGFAFVAVASSISVVQGQSLVAVVASCFVGFGTSNVFVLVDSDQFVMKKKKKDTEPVQRSLFWTRLRVGVILFVALLFFGSSVWNVALHRTQQPREYLEVVQWVFVNTPFDAVFVTDLDPFFSRFANRTTLKNNLTSTILALSISSLDKAHDLLARSGATWCAVFAKSFVRSKDYDDADGFQIEFVSSSGSIIVFSVHERLASQQK
jgi:hypothetical protein